MPHIWPQDEYKVLLRAWEDAKNDEPQTSDEFVFVFSKCVDKRFVALCRSASSDGQDTKKKFPVQTHKAVSLKIVLLTATFNIIAEFISEIYPSDDGGNDRVRVGNALPTLDDPTKYLNLHGSLPNDEAEFRINITRQLEYVLVVAFVNVLL